MADIPAVFIDGESGTTGLGIRERLAELPVRLVRLPAEHRRDAGARRAAMQEADLAVLCLPDAAAREAVSMAAGLATPPKLLDASTAHRVAEGWQYGFPELAPGRRASIAGAARVANPGCYPTGAVALLRPLVEAGIVARDHPLSINAVSGYSGGGKAMIERFEADAGPAFHLYGLSLEHKHVAEVERHAGLSRRPIFVPSVGAFRQGMLVSIPLHLDTLARPADGALLAETLRAYYAGASRIVVHTAEPSGELDAAGLAGSDLLELRVYANDARGHALLVARLDNLGKGASGAAVQNIALMLGLEAG